MLKKILFFAIFVSSLFSTAQTTVKGTIYDEYLEPFPGATIKVPSGTTTSDFEGNFTIKVAKLPVNVTVSSSGYSDETAQVTDASTEINIILKEALALNQVVISASRTPERIMESPVTIERTGQKFNKSTASLNFYEGLKNLKGIDVLDNNYLVKNIVSNRGFANTENFRFVQLVDGVDTSAPVFDYSLGNIFGINELDVENIEILPGSASALYGANAVNGILLATSKNPFDHTGVSAYAKTGTTSEKTRGSAGFLDVGFRFAHKFSDRFAAKVNVTYQTAEDWAANDISNINGEGVDHSNGNTNYDGVNVYGDEISLNLVDLAILAESTPLAALNPLSLLSLTDNPENTRISRTGFQESDIVGNKTVNNLLFDFSLHFKPWKNRNAELILATKQSVGDNVALSGNRFFQENSSQQHYRIELKNDTYFVRAYYNENNAGDTFDSKLAGINIAQSFKSNTDFYVDYATAYFSSLASGVSDLEAHTAARTVVDANLPQDINSLAEEVKNTTIQDGGAKLFENSGFYNIDANWNLSELINYDIIQIGGNFRSYALNSRGQVYTDTDGIIRYRQFGLYTQLQRKFSDDRLKLSATLRYDKSKNFKGQFNPRATISYAAGKKENHNFRIGFQTGFRNPTSQDQYVGLNIGNSILLGSVEDNLDRFSVEVQSVSDRSVFTTITGRDVFENSFTAQSVEAFQNDFRTRLIANGGGFVDGTGTPIAGDASLLVVSDVKDVKPETVRSYEVGYRGAVDLSGRLFEFDVVGFYNVYENFITETEVVVPVAGDVNNITADLLFSTQINDFQRFQITTNADSRINAFGFSAGFNTKIFNNFNLGASYAFSDFNIDDDDDENLNFKPSFNTPKHSFKLQLNTETLFKNLGFGIDLRWQDAFLYQSRFVDRVIDSRLVVDSQVNYQIPSIKSVIKLGATNLTGKEYISVPEAGTIGSQFYIGWTFNN